MAADHVAVLRALAGHGLPGSTLALPDAPLPTATFDRLCEAVTGDHLEGHLVAAVAAGALPTTPAQRQRAGELHTAAAAGTLRLDRCLATNSRLLDQAGVDHRVVGGVALAAVVYPDPALRPYRTVRLLVPGGAWDRAVATLRTAGYGRSQVPVGPRFDRRFAQRTTVVAPDGTAVDLCRTLVTGPAGLRVDLADLFDAPTSFDVAGRTLRTLSRDALVLQACYTAAVGGVPPKLGALRDVAEVVLGQDQRCSRQVLDLAGRWGGRAVLARAVTLTWETLALADAVPVSAWARTYRPTRRERRELACYTGTPRSAPLAWLRGIPRTSDKLAFLRSVARPDWRFLARRGEGVWSWLRRRVHALHPGGGRW